jgi:putative thioredoxin
MLNTDELGQLAREHGVASLPTLKVFRRGQAVDTLHGAESETVLREFITRHVAREAEARYTTAILAYQRGDLDQAVTQAAEAALAEPDNPRLAIDLVKLLVLQRRYAQADGLLKSLPAETRELAEVRHLSAHVNLIRSAEDAPSPETLMKAIAADPDDLEARYRLSAVLLNQDEYELAMMHLLEITRRDSALHHQAGRDGLLAIFALLGEDDERVHRYRALLNKITH